MALPQSTDFTGATITEGGFKIAITAMREFIADTIGTVDGYLRVIGGIDADRPAATIGGWLRWNTDNLTLDISIASSLWHKVVTSIIDATWQLRFDFNSASLALFKSTHTGNIAKVQIQNNAGDTVEVERNATHTVVRSNGTDPVRIEIDGTPVFSIDSSGNVIAAGNVTANGTVA